MELVYYIYLTTNLVNGKKYIGQHYGSVDDRYLGSGVLLTKAVEKYGRENFEKEVLEICTKEELDEKEKYWIKKYNALESEDFYNLSEGGQKGDGWRAAQRYFEKHPEEAKELYRKSGERLKQWMKDHPEVRERQVQTMLEASHKWMREHPEFVEEHMKKVNKAKEEWQKAHPEEHQAQVDAWRKAGSIANSRKVRCRTTGKEFESVSAAARYYNVSQPNITKVLNGQRKHCGRLEDGTQLEWEWVEQ